MTQILKDTLNKSYSIKILFENEFYWVIDKPAGLMVHPGISNQETLTNIWQEKFLSWANLDWSDLTRPGIVHRLDKDTSGIMLIAKTPQSLNKLKNLFVFKKIQKTYKTIVVGECRDKTFNVSASIKRDAKNKTKQNGTNLDLPWNNKARISSTDFELIRLFEYKKYILSELFCYPESGRMHQIRVHLKMKNLPIIGDEKYSNKISRKLNKELDVTRQMLHALKIEFIDPWDSQSKKFFCEPPDDYLKLTNILNKSEADKSASQG